MSSGKWKLKQPWDTATYLFEWSKSRTLTTFYADEDEDWQELLYITGSVQFSSFTQSCLTLCDPMKRTTLGLPVHHQLLESTQTHVHWVGDTIQPSHPIVPFSSHLQSLPASGSFQMNQFFASGGQSIGVSASASVLPMNIQDWFPLGWTGWGLSRVFSNTTVQKHQFFSAQLSL